MMAACRPFRKPANLARVSASPRRCRRALLIAGQRHLARPQCREERVEPERGGAPAGVIRGLTNEREPIRRLPIARLRLEIQHDDAGAQHRVLLPRTRVVRHHHRGPNRTPSTSTRYPGRRARPRSRKAAGREPPACPGRNSRISRRTSRRPPAAPHRVLKAEPAGIGVLRRGLYELASGRRHRHAERLSAQDQQVPAAAQIIANGRPILRRKRGTVWQHQ